MVSLHFLPTVLDPCCQNFQFLRTGFTYWAALLQNYVIVQANWATPLRPPFTTFSVLLSSFRHSASFPRHFNSMEIVREICLHAQDPQRSHKPFQFYCLILIIECFATYLQFARVLVQTQGLKSISGLGMEMSFSLSLLKVPTAATNACHSPDINVQFIKNSYLPARPCKSLLL